MATSSSTMFFSTNQKTFDNYQPQNKSQEDAVKQIMDFVSYENDETGILYIHGNVGVGKSHLAMAIKNAFGEDAKLFNHANPYDSAVFHAITELGLQNTFFIFDDCVTGPVIDRILDTIKTLEDRDDQYTRKFILLSRDPIDVVAKTGLELGYLNQLHLDRFKNIKIEGKDYLNPNHEEEQRVEDIKNIVSIITRIAANTPIQQVQEIEGPKPIPKVCKLQTLTDLQEQFDHYLKHAPEEIKDFAKSLLDTPPSQHDADLIKRIQALYSIPWGVSQVNNDIRQVCFNLLRYNFNLDVSRKICATISTEARNQAAVSISSNSEASAPNKAKPIMCLIGKPGLGKSTYAEKLALELGRTFVKMPLAGARDTFHFKGSNPSYKAATYGSFVTALIKAKTMNPVILLDEIDKVNNNYGALNCLINILDPSFLSIEDDYLGCEISLKDVMFIASANNIENIPAPLLSRFDTIELTEYTFQEKVKILESKKEKFIKELSLNDFNIIFKENFLEKLVLDYSDKEVGLRKVEHAFGEKLKTAAFNAEMEEKSDLELEHEIRTCNSNEIKIPGRCLFISESQDSGACETGIIRINKSNHYQLLGFNNYGLASDNITRIVDIFKSSAWGEYTSEAFRIHFSGKISSKITGRDYESLVFTALCQAATGKCDDYISAVGAIEDNGKLEKVNNIVGYCMAAIHSGATEFIYPMHNNEELEEIKQFIEDKIKLTPISHINDLQSKFEIEGNTERARCGMYL